MANTAILLPLFCMLSLLALSVAMWLHERGAFDAIARLLPRSRAERVLLALVAVGFIHYGATKETNGVRGVSAPLRNVPQRSQASDFVLGSFCTNDVFDFSVPSSAVIHEKWRRRGAAHDRFPLSPAGWTFPVGDTSVTNLTVCSEGRVRLPDGTEIAPLPAAHGIVPEGNWPRLAESSRPSLFWHSLAADGSLVLAWQNVLLHRAATNPVSFLAELKPSGSATFRYDLSRLASDGLLDGIAPSAGGVAQDAPLSRSVTGVDFKSRKEADCDTFRAEFEESLGDLDPFSFPEGSTNTVLEHLFYSGTTNGAFFYPQTNDSTAVLRVSVSGTGSGDLLVGGSYVPLVGVVQRRGAEAQSNCLMLPVSKGRTVPLYLRGDGTLSVSFDSGEFAFGELPDIAENRYAGWINFPNTKATEPCIHDLGRKTKDVTLPASGGAEGLACTWQGGDDVEVENHPPRSATLTATFDPKESGGITYVMSHPKYLFGRTVCAQTVRYCPRPGDDEPSFPEEGEEEDGGDDWCGCCGWSCGECGCPASCGCSCCDHGICPEHSVPYGECEGLHPDDYDDAATNAVATLAGVLYIRDPPLAGDHIVLEVPTNHVNCCPCPDHNTNCVGIAYRSHRLRVTDSEGMPFFSASADCTVDVAGVEPSEAVGDAELAFARNGEVYGRRGYTVLGVGIRRDGIPLERYNDLAPSFGYPMTVCTNQWNAPEMLLVTNVRLPTGRMRIELANATGQFAVWCRDGDGWRRLADTSAAADFPMHSWKAVMRGAGCGGSPELPVRITSSSPGTARLVFRYWAVIDGAFVEDAAEQRITALCPMMADIDGDWSLGDGDMASHLAGRVFRFWTNEDCHKGDYVGQSSDLSPNASDLVVNGRLDLVNLFPVKLDLKPFIDAWGNAAKFVLWSPAGNALRFCGLDARPSEAWAYQTNDVCTTAGGPIHAAALTPVGGEGAEIDPGDCLGSGNEPGVLAFEAAGEIVRSDALTLLVMDGDDMLFSCSIPLVISPADCMYRWKGLRQICGGLSSIPDGIGEPWNMPDVDACDVDVFFIHGFNVSESDARNWSRQVFKRLWLSGSRARFHGFSWYGDYNLAGSVFNGLHYHQDVYHALKTASAFRSHVEATQPISSKRIIMAHSLGNMVAAEALRQGLAVGKYFMFNAAVASEALDDTLQAGLSDDDGYMKYVPSDWHGYTNACWTANWHRWFQNDSADARGRMGWPGYFSAALGNAGTVYNYYSSGDEVFEEMPSTPSLLSGVFHWPTFQTSWPFVDLSSMVTPEVNPWQKQEVLKGVDNIAGTLAGGWGFHFVSNSTSSVTIWRTYTSAEASAMVCDGSVVTNAVFARNALAMFSPSATQEAQWETLAKYIPAVSSSAGRRTIAQDVIDNQNLNDIEYRSGWGRDHPQHGTSWLHSDVKNMAYRYVFPLYNILTEELK